MAAPPRLVPLLEQFDWACLRLLNRMTGPEADSGNGIPVAVTTMTDEEYLGEPVPLFIDIAWWVNQEIPHHGAETALLRDPTVPGTQPERM